MSASVIRIETIDIAPIILSLDLGGDEPIGLQVTGPQGPPGSGGIAGPQGAVGATGPSGLTGLAGPAGPAGATGPVGAAGPAGAAGAQGPAGPTGATGATGAAGVAGPAGAAGAQGPAGATGSAGPAGPQGNPGVVLSAQNIWTGQNSVAIATLTDAATVAWATTNAQKAKVTLGGNRVMAVVTGLVEGATYRLWVVQDATGSRSLDWTTGNVAGAFDFGSDGPPVLSTEASVADLLEFESVVIAGTLKLRLTAIRKGFGRTAAPYPLDVFSGPAALAAWGTFAWKQAALNQPALTVDDGTPVTSAMGANGIVGGSFTGQRIAKLFAQAGSATLEQATLGLRPTLWNQGREGLPEVRFQYRLGTAGNKMLQVLTPPAARSGRDITHVWVQRATGETYSASGNVGWNANTLLTSYTGSGQAHGDSTTSVDPATGNWATNHRVFLGTGGWADGNAPLKPTIKYAVHVTRYDATGVTLWVDGKKVAFTATLATNANVQPYKLGQLNDIAGGYEHVAYLGSAFFPALTDAQVTEITNLLHARLYGATPQSLWLFDGDSITAGYSVADGNRDRRDLSWPYDLVTALTPTQRALVTAANLGHASAHLETAASTEHKLMLNQTGKVNAHLAGYAASYTHRVVVLCAGTNDIAFGTTDANAILTKLSTYRTAALAAGATRVLICTQVPRQTFTAPQETVRTTLNGLILSTFGTDAIDVAAQNWKPGGAADWSSCYQDGAHPNANGRALFVAAIKATMVGLV